MQFPTQSAIKLYGDAMRATQPGAATTPPDAGAGASSFAETIATAAEETVRTIAAGEQTAQAGIAGKAAPHSVVEALAQTEMALEMAVTVRDKVVEAYQEILRMPI